MNQRHLRNDDETHSEWNVTLEKGIRLPGKAAADRRIGKATVDESSAAYGAALIQACHELIGMWLDWLAAERGHELAMSNLKAAQANLAAVEKRTRAGDASRLDMGLARAELADQRRLENDARTQADATWSLLSTRFPGLERRVTALPEPLPLKEEAFLWRQRVIGESHALRVMQARMRNAQAQADRARADKIPDPTLGVYSASEAGHERVYGLIFSVPIPTGLRSANSAKSLAALEVFRQDEALARRQLEAAIASVVAAARGSYESMQIAREGAAAMQENANLMQRAYTLGEAELQAMLIARRPAPGERGAEQRARGAGCGSQGLLWIAGRRAIDLGAGQRLANADAGGQGAECRGGGEALSRTGPGREPVRHVLGILLVRREAVEGHGMAGEGLCFQAAIKQEASQLEGWKASRR